MATLIVPGVARFSVLQQLEGRNVVNVLDYRIDTTGSTMDREEACENQARDIFLQWAENPMDWQVDDLSLLGVTWLDLDDADGSTGTVTSSGAISAPVPGAQTSAPLPANTAVLIRKETTGGRGSRNGRLYLAGLDESKTLTTDGNRLEPTTQTALTTSFATFLSNTNNTDTLGTAFSSDMVVVQVTARDANDHPTAGVGRVVSQLSVDGLLATQRRRLRR